jgi:AAA+ ATPase superfamily predicted ATPase
MIVSEAMNMFVGRTEDLEILEEQYVSEKFSFPVIYGRRRVGKSTLIKKHMEGKRTIYIQAVEGNVQLNLEILSNAIDGFVHGDEAEIIERRPYRNFLEAFDEITRIAKKEKLLVVFDEYPYLASSEPSISSLLQSAIDNHWKELDMQLILCGSSMSFMERQVLGYKSPLYGRSTTQLFIQPFTFSETLDYFIDLDREKALGFYALTGGVAQYLEFIQPEKTVMENVRMLFLRNGGLLREEPENLLKQELKDPSNYATILEAIASGATRHNDIQMKTQIHSNLSRYLSNLIDLGIIEKISPVGETKTSKNSLYKIKDDLFRFWYRFIFPNQSVLMLSVDGLATYIEQQFSNFCGPVFEKVCREWLPKNVPFLYAEIGSWWGTKVKNRGAEEIDILALDISRKNAIFGECKWRNEKVDESVVSTLVERTDLFSYREKQQYIFSKSGFTEGASTYADKNGVQLISYSDMY